MAELFQIKFTTINVHLKAMYADEEIQIKATIRMFLIVRREGAVNTVQFPRLFLGV
jgi:hypothetical protein